MLYDRLEGQILIENPVESLQLIGELLLGSTMDEDATAKLIEDVTLKEDEGTRDGWTNYDMTMEFYPIRLSPESTQLLLDAFELSEGDIPDAPIEV
jgi:hypothetical protein